MMYLLREKPRGPIVQTEEVRAVYTEHHRTKRIHDSPIGPIREVEATGPDKRYFYLQTQRVVRADGTKGYAHNPMVKAEQSAIQKVIRRMRDDDLVRLAEYDAYIEEAKRALSKEREDRKTFLAEAWKQADRFSIRVLREQADAVQENRTYVK